MVLRKRRVGNRHLSDRRSLREALVSFFMPAARWRPVCVSGNIRRGCPGCRARFYLEISGGLANLQIEYEITNNKTIMKKFLLSMSACFLAMQTFAQSEQTFNLVTSVDALNTTDKYLVALQPVMVGKVQYGLWAMGEAKENGKGFTGVEITPDIRNFPKRSPHRLRSRR